jgi:hypothetical protein
MALSGIISGSKLLRVFVLAKETPGSLVPQPPAGAPRRRQWRLWHFLRAAAQTSSVASTMLLLARALSETPWLSRALRSAAPRRASGRSPAPIGSLPSATAGSSRTASGDSFGVVNHRHRLPRCCFCCRAGGVWCDRLTRPRIRGRHRLEEVQNMLCKQPPTERGADGWSP